MLLLPLLPRCKHWTGYHVPYMPLTWRVYLFSFFHLLRVLTGSLRILPCVQCIKIKVYCIKVYCTLLKAWRHLNVHCHRLPPCLEELVDMRQTDAGGRIVLPREHQLCKRRKSLGNCILWESDSDWGIADWEWDIGIETGAFQDKTEAFQADGKTSRHVLKRFRLGLKRRGLD